MEGDSDNKEQPETIEVVEEVKAEVEKVHEEAEPVIKSLVKSLEEKAEPLIASAKSLVEGTSESSVVKGIKEFINKHQHKDSTEERSQPLLEEISGETAVASRDLSEENSRVIHAQPFYAASAGSRASLANCCGLLDLFKQSDRDK